ncbi:mannose-1-phosphate guanylyltransferase/mannose-6-phosphate isomerase [Marinimicrobium alkaliphilum]|uniref:mannose-1-phosphate guanylyltransferase/mannose-6-phosphate isomerase n=1 Tax=Marinimicrobium alkaliphilum TaxID=2202654 RepID=UPI000DBA5C2B|nr:mannose-1-phosphate guanylyltransferase/mannose-6-phosphate isomerase [Marinimicrobium alkaliphilum]
MSLIPVIMSGGAGSRLWPVSRSANPKPFMELPGGANLIRQTFERARNLPDVGEILTVTNRDLYFRTDDEYREVGAGETTLSYILEPFGRNTAAAVAAAALQVQQTHGDDAQVLILAADHLIRDSAAFQSAVAEARLLAADDWLVTFGIHPHYPETGFGYIEADAGQALGQGGGCRVARFVEKPAEAQAQVYLDAGNYYWNSGMFCFKVSSLLKEMREHCPQVLDAVARTLEASGQTEGPRQRCINLDIDNFSQVPDISIDYALMELSQKVAVIPCRIGWSDMGSWNSMEELTEPDDAGNRLEGEVLVESARNNYVYSPYRLSALLGVEDLIVVDTEDALLVARKDHAQNVKEVVSKLKKAGNGLQQFHRTVHRPWGTFTVIEEGLGFKIKRIEVKPGASLSLQMHHHRSEHWIVVSGTAKVVNGEQEILLRENESTFIPMGHKHRLANPGLINLVLIEVQSGSYLGEDDIVRFEDTYGRS